MHSLVQHFELVTFDEVFWPWGKAKCNKETFGGSIFHIVFLVFFKEHILQSVPVIVQEARQFCLGFCNKQIVSMQVSNEEGEKCNSKLLNSLPWELDHMSIRMKTTPTKSRFYECPATNLQVLW